MLDGFPQTDGNKNLGAIETTYSSYGKFPES